MAKRILKSKWHDKGADWRGLAHSPAHRRSKKNLTKSLAQHWAQDWARDWRALALTQVHHWSRLSDSGEDGEALSSVHSTALAAGKLIHNLLCDVCFCF